MPEENRSGELVIVGTGYLVGGQVTAQARAHIEQAERLFYLAGDPVTARFISGLHAGAESLADLYGPGKSRRATYRQMIDRLLEAVRRGERVCAAFYGHPGVGVDAAHQAIREARAEGYAASMLPGISAEDCLFADLGVDPVASGCQSYEATDFLLRARQPEPTVPLVLWQIGAVGVEDYRAVEPWSEDGLAILAEVLLEHYPAEHVVTIYEAAMLPVCAARIEEVALAELAAARASTASTLFVPAAREAAVDPRMRERLRRTV